MDARIERLQRAAAECPGIIGLGGGLPAPELFPRGALAEAFLGVLGVPGCSALQYGWPEGDRELREWIADRLRARGAAVDADDVIVTNGAQQAIAIAVERLIQTGRRVGVDAESYPAALDLLRARGATLCVDADVADFVYAMPGIANPRGDSMSPAARRVLLALGAPIIADEAYAELRFDGLLDRPFIADARERTWHVGTVSKTLSPGLRVGWLVPPPTELEATIAAKRDRDLQAGSLAQEIVRAYVAEHDFDSRLAAIRAFYEARAHRLVRSLRRRIPSLRFREPDGGFSIYAETDIEGDDTGLLEHATSHGVTFDPGRLFRADEASTPIAMRLCFSNTPQDEIDEAVKRLASALRAFHQTSERERRYAGSA